MLNKAFLNDGGFIWPPRVSKSIQTRPSSAFFPIRTPVSPGRVRHQAFAVGFFGFHYIRATVENAPSLRKDSLRHLMQLLEDLQVADGVVKNREILAKQSYFDFKERIIKKISLELGDNFSPPAQWMVQFGFHLASMHSFLVAASECQAPAKLRDSLNYFVSQLPSLLWLARKSEVSETLLEPMVDFLDVIRCQKTRQAARKCCKKIGLVLSQLLVTNTAVKLLN
jgi:hypothetical protein